MAVGNVVPHASIHCIYKLDDGQIIVHVVFLGIRREGDKSDVYALAQKLVKLGLRCPVVRSACLLPRRVWETVLYRPSSSRRLA